MKKINFSTFVLLALCACVLPLTACDDDDKQSIEPITTDSVIGSYSGTLTIGKDTCDAVVTVGNDNKIAISDFPVDSLVSISMSIASGSEADVSVEPVDYAIDYTSDIFGFNIFLSMTPAPLEVDFTYAGQSHKLVANFYTKNPGNYNSTSSNMSFELYLETLTCDGHDVSIANSLSYKYDLNKD